MRTFRGMAALMAALAMGASAAAPASAGASEVGQVMVGAPICVVDYRSPIPVTCGRFEFVDTGIVCNTSPCPSTELRFIEFDRPGANRIIDRPAFDGRNPGRG